MTPLYGWGEKSERVNEYVPDMRFQRTSIISVLGTEGFAAPMTYDGTMNKTLFSAYLKECLAPTLQTGDIVIMDNSSVHTAKGILQPIYDVGATVLFLPKYSPDLNPIEMAWSKMKIMLKKLKAQTKAELQDAFVKALDYITADDINGYFRHDGYLCV